MVVKVPVVFTTLFCVGTPYSSSNVFKKTVFLLILPELNVMQFQIPNINTRLHFFQIRSIHVDVFHIKKQNLMQKTYKPKSSFPPNISDHSGREGNIRSFQTNFQPLPNTQESRLDELSSSIRVMQYNIQMLMQQQSSTMPSQYNKPAFHSNQNETRNPPMMDTVSHNNVPYQAPYNHSHNPTQSNQNFVPPQSFVPVQSFQHSQQEPQVQAKNY